MGACLGCAPSLAAGEKKKPKKALLLKFTLLPSAGKVVFELCGLMPCMNRKAKINQHRGGTAQKVLRLVRLERKKTQQREKNQGAANIDSCVASCGLPSDKMLLF